MRHHIVSLGIERIANIAKQVIIFLWEIVFRIINEPVFFNQTSLIGKVLQYHHSTALCFHLNTGSHEFSKAGAGSVAVVRCDIYIISGNEEALRHLQ